MPTLYESEDALRAVHERLSEALEQNEGIEEATEALVGQVEHALIVATEKRDGCAMFLKRLEADEDYVGKEIARLSAVRDSIRNGREKFLYYVKRVMETRGLTEIQGRTVKFKLVQNPAHVEVGAMEALPVDCVRVIPERYEPDKVEIAKRLKAGEEVPGARMVPGEVRLKVSSKRV